MNKNPWCSSLHATLFKHLFKSYYIHIMRLLNLFKNHIVHYKFRLSMVIITCFKNCSAETAVFAFFSSNAGCVFRGAACFLVPRCVFRPPYCCAIQRLQRRLATCGAWRSEGRGGDARLEISELQQLPHGANKPHCLKTILSTICFERHWSSSGVLFNNHTNIQRLITGAMEIVVK
jgi:hypothetical protein